MSVKSQQLIRPHFFWALVICLVLSSFSFAQAAQQVTLAWDGNTPAPEGYRVYQRMEGQSYNYASPVWPQAGDDPSATSCTLNDLVDDTSYYFVVRAYVGADESGDSNEVHHSTGAGTTTQYSISTDAGVNGSISPTSATVPAGGSQSFSIAADSGYHIADVRVDGSSVGAVSSYSFNNIDANHSISAQFAVNTYSITATHSGSGSISPSGTTTVVYQGSQSYSMVPGAGYSLVDVVVDGQSMGPLSSYTFSGIAASHSIHAVFEQQQYTIEASAGSGGSISPTGTINAAHGESCTLTIAPASGYQIADVRVDGSSVGAVSSYSFNNVDANHSISASFTAAEYRIWASAGSGGTITPTGEVAVAAGSDQSFSVSADTGYVIDALVVDGTAMGALSSYSFVQIDGDHSIAVTFKPGNLEPVADAGPDQVVDEQQQVTLSGLNSTDPDDGIERFAWRQINGFAVQLSGTSKVVASFTAPDVDTNGQALEFELTVTDYSGAQSTDRCIVNVTWVNQPPVAHTGADQSVNEGTAVVLSADGSSDPDDGIQSYQWRQVQGPAVDLAQADSVSASFTAPAVDALGATLGFELTVTDMGGLQATANCVVTVTWDNMEPLADAGADQLVVAGQEVVLDGTASMDPDSLGLDYQWHQTFGPPVILSDATADCPKFSVPVEGFDGLVLIFELTVTDSGGLQAMDTCQVTVDANGALGDTAVPTLSIDGPTGGAFLVSDDYLNIYGSAQDDIGVVEVSWQTNRGESGYAVGTNLWTIANLYLHPGSNMITVTAWDADGNQSSLSFTLYRTKWWRNGE